MEKGCDIARVVQWGISGMQSRPTVIGAALQLHFGLLHLCIYNLVWKKRTWAITYS